MTQDTDDIEALMNPTEAICRGLLNERNSYRRGNTDLIAELMDLVDHFADPLPGEWSRLSSNEGTRALGLLVTAGFAERGPEGTRMFRLLKSKLDERKKLDQPMTWAEAVEKYVADPDERARLLALEDATE